MPGTRETSGTMMGFSIVPPTCTGIRYSEEPSTTNGEAPVFQTAQPHALHRATWPKLELLRAMK